MAEVQWIKIYTNMFDISRKIKKIELMPQGDTILIIWFKLLTLAGKVNDGGAIYITQSIPYEIEDLVEELRRPEDIVEKALSVFEMFNMIERDNGFIYISSWEEYQNIEGMEKIREQNRLAQQRSRARRKLLQSEKNKNNDMSCDSHVTVMQSHDIDKEEDKEKDKDIIKEIHKEKTTPQQIVDLFNSICVSFPSVSSLSEARKRAINARLNSYTIDDFKKCFEIAESSSFLKGENDRNWTATFDWLIKDANMPKVLEGQYANKKCRYGDFDVKEVFKQAVERSYGNLFVEPEMHKSENPKTVADDEALRERADALRQKISQGSGG